MVEVGGDRRRTQGDVPKRPQARRFAFGPVFTRAACKPSSVLLAVSFATAIDGGPTRKTCKPATTISLGLLLPATSSSLPACIVRTRLKRTLFGLARGGVCRAVTVTSDAVGSYPTFSPLLSWVGSESRPTQRYLLCGTVPRSECRDAFATRGTNGWALPTTVSCRARTFLSGPPLQVTAAIV